jgi:hypothetical protein
VLADVNLDLKVFGQILKQASQEGVDRVRKLQSGMAAWMALISDL